MAFKKVSDSVSGEKFKFENEGDVLEGYYLGSETIEINGKPATKQNFLTDGGLVSPLGSKDLNQKLAQITPGTRVRATFEGQMKIKGGKNFNKFMVEADDEDTIDPSTVSTQARTSKAPIPRKGGVEKSV